MPKRYTTEAGKWLSQHAPSWSGKLEKPPAQKPRASRVGRKRVEAIRTFVERNRDYRGQECLMVPGSVRDVPATVEFCGKKIRAARYMLLLTQGTPSSDGMQAQHKCGNGHLSCVNPAHLKWGTPGDNIGDANIHRAMDGAEVGEKCMAVDARTSK